MGFNGRFACVSKKTGQVIGFVGLHHPRWIPSLPWVALSARILPEYQRQGYTQEAAQEIVRAGFEKGRLPEIGFYAANSNKASLAILEKAKQWGAYEQCHLLVNWSGNRLFRLSHDAWQYVQHKHHQQEVVKGIYSLIA